jgi:hypothetical protein
MMDKIWIHLLPQITLIFADINLISAHPRDQREIKTKHGKTISGAACTGIIRCGEL